MGFTLAKKERISSAFYLRCNLFVSVSFLPPVILVMIYEAL